MRDVLLLAPSDEFLKFKKKKIRLWDLINWAGAIAAASTWQFKPFGFFYHLGYFMWLVVLNSVLFQFTFPEEVLCFWGRDAGGHPFSYWGCASGADAARALGQPVLGENWSSSSGQFPFSLRFAGCHTGHYGKANSAWYLVHPSGFPFFD